jgi:hypothetical protein
MIAASHSIDAFKPQGRETSTKRSLVEDGIYDGTPFETSIPASYPQSSRPRLNIGLKGVHNGDRVPLPTLKGFRRDGTTNDD